MTNEQLQAETERLQLEKAKLQAEKDVADAKKALADANTALDAATRVPDETAENLRKQKEIVDAQKALADSKRAMLAANTTPDSTVVELQKQKELVDAKKALADAQKALETATKEPNQVSDELASQKQLLDARKAVVDAQAALDAVTAVPSELKAQKALAEARRDAANAEIEAWKAKNIGTVAGAEFSGKVDLKEGAGKVEGALLAAVAVRKGAVIIAEKVTSISGVNHFELFAAKDFPKFQHLQTFRFQKEMIEQGFEFAGIEKPSSQPGREEAATPAMIGAGFEALSKILSWLKTDYTIGGSAVTIDESVLLYSVAGEIAEKGKIARLSSIYQPSAMAASVKATTAEIAELIGYRSEAVAKIESASRSITELETLISGSTDDNEKQALNELAGNLRSEIEKINGAISACDKFLESLVTSDPATGTSPLNGLVVEKSLENSLNGGAAVVLLRLESTGGSYFVAKNLLTGLGKMPLHYMGGATVSYVVLSGSEGNVLAGGVIPVHGGFVKAQDLEEKLLSSESKPREDIPRRHKSNPSNGK